MSKLAALQGASLGTSVDGFPTRLREGVVKSVGTDGTLSVAARVGRKVWEDLWSPAWYAPAKGDLVLVATLDGDRQRPMVLCPLWTGSRGAPGLKTGGVTGEVTLAKLTEAGKTGNLTIKDGLITAVSEPS